MGALLIIAFIVIIPIIIFIYLKSKQIVNSKGEKVETINQKDRLAVLFFEECQKRGITSMSDAKSIQTALEILKYNVNFKNLPQDTTTAHNLFNQGKEAINELNQREKDIKNERKWEKQEKESHRRDLLGDEGYKVIKAARRRMKPDELFSSSLKFVVYMFQNDVEEIKDGYQHMYVFKGENGYYSYIPELDKLTEGMPNIFIKHMYSESYTKEPDQLIYTSATVGGVTTGGFDVAKGGYKRHIDMSGGYSIFIGYGFKRQVHNQIKNIWCNDEMLKYLEYNGASSLISARNKRKLVVGETSKETCNTIAYAMKQ